MVRREKARPLKTSNKSPRRKMRDEIAGEMVPSCLARPCTSASLSLSDALTRAAITCHPCSPLFGRSLRSTPRPHPTTTSYTGK